jgi:arylsulfatase A-like enzyme
MDATPLRPGTQRGPSPNLLSLAHIMLLALALGLCGGYLDLIVMTVMKYWWNDLRYFWSGSDFPWSVPVAHTCLLGVAGALVALVSRIGPRWLITLRTAAWLFATLAIWSGLLRVPLYGACTLVLAAGLARPISAAVTALSRRRVRYALTGLLGLLVVLAALSSGLRSVRNYHAMSALPAPAQGARNIVLIVWDTVRAPSVSLYGYDRDNTPNLRRWAQKGARYVRAIAPAPWTYPSHSSFFTGQWPYQLNTQWNSRLDTTSPTLAEYLASRGYQTVGFAANTRCCSYETGLDRGFAHYEDYPLTPRSLLARTVPGNWILMNILSPGDFYEAKWINLQSRDASGINDAFLDWLKGRQQDRPFFAFLNYYDAHSPFIAPSNYMGRFGIQPKYPEDYRLLFDFKMEQNDPNWIRNMDLARAAYDDCIASLDDQLGRLLNALLRQRLLQNTLVIITGDHGESFGDHNVFSHGTALYIDQIAVPLVILSPDAPAGLRVGTPVSLRDLPATVVDQLGLSAGSPFPGHSLAAFWSSAPGQPPPKITPALSELVGNSLEFTHRDDPSHLGFQMSLISQGWHYIRDGAGPEQLYDLTKDMGELKNLANSADGKMELQTFRRLLLDTLSDNAGSVEVEKAYLKPYRQQLKSLVQASSTTAKLTTATVGSSVIATRARGP